MSRPRTEVDKRLTDEITDLAREKGLTAQQAVGHYIGMHPGIDPARKTFLRGTVCSWVKKRLQTSDASFNRKIPTSADKQPKNHRPEWLARVKRENAGVLAGIAARDGHLMD